MSLWAEAEALAKLSGPGAIGRSVSALVADALRQYIDERKGLDQRMEAIELDIGGPDSPRRVRFVGRWLVEPGRGEKVTAEGFRGGVALTKRGNIVVYSRSTTTATEARLDTYPSLDAAAAEGMPENVYQAAKAKMDLDVVEELEI